MRKALGFNPDTLASKDSHFANPNGLSSTLDAPLRHLPELLNR
jgi:hypothetical protein